MVAPVLAPSSGDPSNIAKGRDMVTQVEAQMNAHSEARYRGLLEAAPDAMVVVDHRGEIVLLNVQAEKQFGYKRDELVGQPVTNIIRRASPSGIIADDLRSAADALAQQIGTGIELVAPAEDGTEFPIEIMLSPLESAEGILITGGHPRHLPTSRRGDRPSPVQCSVRVGWLRRNEAIVHAPDETTLLASVCRVAVEHGGYLGAWIVRRRHVHQGRIVPVASAGSIDAYIRPARDQHERCRSGRREAGGNDVPQWLGDLFGRLPGGSDHGSLGQGRRVIRHSPLRSRCRCTGAVCLRVSSRCMPGKGRSSTNRCARCSRGWPRTSRSP